MDKYHDMLNRLVRKSIKRNSDRRVMLLMQKDGSEVSFYFRDILPAIKQDYILLKNSGVTMGCRVALISESSPYSVLMNLVLAYLGIKAVLIDPELPVEEVHRLIDEADVSGIISSDIKLNTVLKKYYFKVPAFVLTKRFGIEHISNSPIINSKMFPLSDDDVIAIIYSSGTTGVNKGVEITYRSIILTCKWCHDYDILGDDVRYLDVIPSNHIAGYSTAMASFPNGTEIGFIEEISSSSLLNALLKFNPRNFIMVPKVYEVMMEKIKGEIAKSPVPVKMYADFAIKTCSFVRRYTGIKLRFLTKPIWKKAFGKDMLIVGSGTAPCKREIAQFYLDLGMNFMDVYGSTELGLPVTSTNVFEKYPVDGAGNITELPYVKLKISEPDSNGVGEIRVKSVLVMKGYFKDPEMTKASFDESGYFRTGDLGYVDENGNLHIVGRIKESIVLSNGKKVSPADVDDYYSKICPDIKLASC